ncbi:MAG: hypothetical protein M1828_001434 [Chrysothrix sp. TS-e1954]|nr:MAG: hypothetical protein M1828_001434 [Chrysothrix sp. TS-e1954]
MSERSLTSRVSYFALWILAIIGVLLLIEKWSPYQTPQERSAASSFGIQGHSYKDGSQTGSSQNITSLQTKSKAIVAASVKGDNVTWLHEYFQDWEINIYVMNDPHAKMTVTKNKGNEASAYLTYIITHYHNLPDHVVFVHARRYQWHNEDPMYDHVPVLRSLQLAHVTNVGYASLRCTWEPGCPVRLRPEVSAQDGIFGIRSEYAKSFKQLFPGADVPREVGAPCCAQFAVSRQRIRQRSVFYYERLRQWIWDSELLAGRSGRILEYMWHIAFGQSAVDSMLSATNGTGCLAGIKLFPETGHKRAKDRMGGQWINGGRPDEDDLSPRAWKPMGLKRSVVPVLKLMSPYRGSRIQFVSGPDDNSTTAVVLIQSDSLWPQVSSFTDSAEALYARRFTMRLANQATALTALASIPILVNSVNLDCNHIRVDKVDFDLNALKGPHSVYQVEKTGTGETRNRTFTFDLCKNLDYSDRAKGCESGARACAFDRTYEKKPSKEIEPNDAWTIAGNFEHSGRHLDPVTTRLKTEANSEKDTDQEGLRVELRGGVRPNEDKRPQKFIIDLICDADRSGLEDDEKRRRTPVAEARDDEDEGGDEDDKPSDSDPNKALQFVSYKATPGKGQESSKVFDVLQLRWHTKYGCEGEAGKDSGDGKAGSHWGFFTWFIIIVFLLIATYLIFGSWLNYNKHGARGWDLLPHGDTIRDVPYMMKDWARRVISTVQGGGNSSGYIRV